VFLWLCSKLDPKIAQDCDPGFKTVRDNDRKLYFGGQGRVLIDYVYKAGPPEQTYFNIHNDADLPDLLITGIFNGIADDDHPNLPLTRSVSGLAVECRQHASAHTPFMCLHVICTHVLHVLHLHTAQFNMHQVGTPWCFVLLPVQLQ
jgi:hypothetical protein